MSARLKNWMVRIGLTYGVLVCVGFQVGMHQPAIAALPLSIMVWEWVGTGLSWWRLRRLGKSIVEHREEVNAQRGHSSAQGNSIFDRLVGAAHRVFPRAADPRYPLELVIFSESRSTPSSPFLMKAPISGYTVFYPEGLLSLYPNAQQFILAHEITHYCLRKSWHHVFPNALFWASTATALATVALPASAGLFALLTFVVVWAASLLLVQVVSRHRERCTDEGAVRILLELDSELQQLPQGKRSIDWGNVVAQTFEALIPKEAKRWRNYGFSVWWRGSVSFGDSHPPPITRARAVRNRFTRFRESEAQAIAARRKFLNRCSSKGRLCDCGSGNWFGACCGRMPKFDVTPWRCRRGTTESTTAPAEEPQKSTS